MTKEVFDLLQPGDVIMCNDNSVNPGCLVEIHSIHTYNRYFIRPVNAQAKHWLKGNPNFTISLHNDYDLVCRNSNSSPIKFQDRFSLINAK